MAQMRILPDFPAVFAKIKDWLMSEKPKCNVFGILVVGETGSGKSTLISNLLLEDIESEGGKMSFESQTSEVREHAATVQGVRVVLYDTPGLDDSRGAGHDAKYLQKMKEILDSGDIQLVLYCFKLNEIRMRASLIKTFQAYHKIHVDWNRTVMALTFADYVPVPGKEKKKPDFNMCRYFDGKVADLHEHIKKTLVERVGVETEAVQTIKVCPSTSDPSDSLPNGKQWFVPLWLDVLDLLSPGATACFFQIHLQHLKRSHTVATGVGTSKPPSTSKNDTPKPESTIDMIIHDFPQKVNVDQTEALAFGPEEEEKLGEIMMKKAQDAKVSLPKQAEVATANGSLPKKETNAKDSKSNGCYIL